MRSQTTDRSAIVSQRDCWVQILDLLWFNLSEKSAQLAQAIAHDDLDQVMAQSVPVRGYKLLELLGGGSFGSVHQAYQPLVSREVGVKIIKPAFAKIFILNETQPPPTTHDGLTPNWDLFVDWSHATARYERAGRWEFARKQAIG